MILIAVDDLLFSSKIRAAAKQAGVAILFARTPADIIQQARVAKPSLAIFDLTSEKIDSIGTIRALKADAELGGIRTLGFVSHVRADVVAAAREAGVDEVVARSAFAARLVEILQHG